MIPVMIEKETPNIYEFIDYRKFLEEYREARIKWDKGFTHLYICHRLGMKNSRGYFNNIVKGRKNIGNTTLDKMIKLLELPADESNYFRAIVQYGQAKASDEKEYWFEQIVQLNDTPKKVIEPDTYEYFREWYNVTIKELLDIVDFREEYAMLANKLDPKVPVSKVKKSIELLKRLNLISPNEEGYLKPTNKTMVTRNRVESELITQYQLKYLERSREKISTKKKQKTSTIAVPLSSEALQLVIKKMDQFRAEVRSIAHQDQSDGKRVFEFLIHGHSLSQ